MLIDTQANGTAIAYDSPNSRRSIVHRDKQGMVEMPDGKAEGYEATDQICLDEDENICLEDFDFLWASKSFEYPKVTDIRVGGVIPFNRYGADDYMQR